MKKLTISEPEIIFGLQDEIRRSEEAKYDHRIHSLLLIAQGKSCSEAAKIFGDSVRAVQYWVNRFEEEGLSGLIDADKPGRQKRLTNEQILELGKTIRRPPKENGLEGQIWDGKTLSAYILKRYKVKLGVRQCQRLFKQLGFRLRKPRPAIAHGDPEQQAAYKKTSHDDE
jgi:transposase